MTLDDYLTDEAQDSSIVLLADKLGLTVDECLTAYLIVGKSFPHLLKFLAGRVVKFPSNRAIKASFSRDYIPVRINRDYYDVAGVPTPPSQLTVGAVFNLDGSYLEVVSKPRLVFGISYAICREVCYGK